MDPSPSDTEDELPWDQTDQPDRNASVRRRVARLTGALSIFVTIGVLVVIAIVLYARRTYDNLPVDGFFKHDNANSLLRIAEAVPVPRGLTVISREPSQGTGDVPSDGTVTYGDPMDRANLCALTGAVLAAKHWQPSAFGVNTFIANSPVRTKPETVQITVRCGTYGASGKEGLSVEVDGQ